MALAALLLLVVGCQNNSERDLIARDRRRQEDQVYAMQDYLQQYQQLLCRYRTENATLKQQLAEGYEVEPSRVVPQPMPRTNSNIPTKNVPKFETPPLPGTNQKQPPQPDIEVPDVPPLKSTTWNDSNRGSAQPANDTETQDGSSPRVLTASYDVPAASERKSNAADVDSTSARSSSSPDVLVSGEVVANETGGPRLMIDIAPFDKSGRAGVFEGQVSLMLLTPGSNDQPRSLGRWDFGPNEVRSAIDPKANKPNMRFFVELPAGTQIDESTELWVRLVPSDGAKLLAHATVDLTRPGVFSSRANKHWPTEEAVVATNYVDTSLPATEVATTVNDSTWAVAEPGRPANLPPDSASASYGWRAATEPLPTIITAASDATPKRSFNKLSDESRIPPIIAAKEPAKPPTWSPDRADGSTQRVAARPSWSATR